MTAGAQMTYDTSNMFVDSDPFSTLAGSSSLVSSAFGSWISHFGVAVARPLGHRKWSLNMESEDSSKLREHGHVNIFMNHLKHMSTFNTHQPLMFKASKMRDHNVPFVFSWWLPRGWWFPTFHVAWGSSSHTPMVGVAGPPLSSLHPLPATALY